jgi:CRP-like cAMP-binding protein
MAALATELLRTPNVLAVMDDEDLRVVVSHMQLVTFPAGRIMMQEGDCNHTAYLLLMLVGEATVESHDAVGGTPIDISVKGPGNIIGETGLLSGGSLVRASEPDGSSAAHLSGSRARG